MMQKSLAIKIQPSKSYLTLTILACLLSLFASWYYFYHLWLSILINVMLLIWLYYFLPKMVLLNQPDSITHIVVGEGRLFIEKNNHSTRQYSGFYPLYQSRFLVIIGAGKQSIVIFKDATQARSLSALNRIINAHP